MRNRNPAGIRKRICRFKSQLFFFATTIKSFQRTFPQPAAIQQIAPIRNIRLSNFAAIITILALNNKTGKASASAIESVKSFGTEVRFREVDFMVCFLSDFYNVICWRESKPFFLKSENRSSIFFGAILIRYIGCDSFLMASSGIFLKASTLLYSGHPNSNTSALPEIYMEASFPKPVYGSKTAILTYLFSYSA